MSPAPSREPSRESSRKSSRQAPRRPGLRFGIVLLLLVVLGVGFHAWWWYAPRVRPALPDGAEPTGRLLAAGELPVALWIPYPHQNLAVLEEGVGDGEERRRFLAATARLADLPEPRLPGFGPFSAPPSRSLVVLSDLEGERVFVAARVYPALALVARLAGRLAGNPWLAGGEVEAFGGTARVGWDGTLWTAGNVPLEALLPPSGPAGDPPPTGPAGPQLPDRPILGALRLARPVSFLPAGVLRLEGVEDGLLVVAGDTGAGGGEAGNGAAPLAAAEAVLAELPMGEGVALLAVSGPGGPLEERTRESAEPPLPEAGSGDGRGALALFPGAGGALGDLLGGLPGAAAWYLPGGERFRLPVERLLSPSRQRALPPAEEGGPAEGGPAEGEPVEGGPAGGMDEAWALVATTPESLAAARGLTPAVDRLAATTAVALAADPGRALAAVDSVADVLRVVPLASSEEVQRWRDWRTVLSPLAGFGRLTVVAVVPRPVPPALPAATETPLTGLPPGPSPPAGGVADDRVGAFRLRLVHGPGRGP